MLANFGLGRGFSPSTSSPTVPDATLSVVDQLDGTGATATIAGTVGGSDNDIRVYNAGGNGVLGLVDTFTRSGNGTVDLVLDPGAYLAELVSDDYNAAAPVLFVVTLADSPFTTARGPITLAEHAAMLALRDCTAFRSWCGATTEAQAQARIYFDWPPIPPHGSDSHPAGTLSGYRPYACIFTPEYGESFSVQRVAAEGWCDSGVIAVDLMQDVPASIERDPAEVFRRFKNTIGQIISYPDGNGLMQLSHTCPDNDHAYLAITNARLLAVRRSDEDDEPGLGDFLHARLELNWGVR